MPTTVAPAATPRRVRAGDPSGSEARLARVALAVGAALVIPTVAVALATRGTAGAVAAGGALALVIGVFALTGMSHAWAARRSPQTLLAVALLGFLLRLSLYGGGVLVLRRVDGLDATTLAITTAFATVALLAVEVRFVLRHPEFWWVGEAPRSKETP